MALRTRPPAVARPAAPPDTDGEPALVARAKRDREAFAELYRRYVDRVYRYCYHRLGSREEAEDATSAVFLRALAALPTCRDDAFRGWLFAIAHNVVTDRYRSRRPAVALAKAGELIDWRLGPEDLALAADDARAVRALLAQLTADQRRVLELRLAGLTDAEIGAVLGRGRGAVRATQFRAVSRLRALLGVKETGYADG